MKRSKKRRRRTVLYLASVFFFTVCVFTGIQRWIRPTVETRLIYQAIEELAKVHGYDLNTNIEDDYDGKGIALWLASEFEHELENQCDLHLKKIEKPHLE